MDNEENGLDPEENEIFTFSEELRIMDRNTVKFMIREMEQKIENLKQKKDDLKRQNESDALENQKLRQRNRQLQLEIDRHKKGKRMLKIE